ncbi:MIP/aquaporin family protein [Vagococcus sp.]|uniref:MIP/aquaporin family protein n=1 Tax=Vagococcus sp. TaxID=1933889 RepID=UPI003F989749
MDQVVLGEFIGTFVLTFFGCGVGCSINLKKTLANAVGKNWVMVALGWGVAVMLGVYSAGYFGAPGHLNPALSLAFAIGGLMTWDLVVPFIIAQMLGGFLGALIVAIHFLPHFKATGPDEGNTVGIFATAPAINSPINNLISEIIATFAFVFTLLLLPAEDFAGGLQPLVFLFILIGISFSFGSTTGYAINPARDLAPRLMYTLVPLPNKNKDYNWKYAWVPLFGPIIGATLAVLIVKVL